MLQKHIKAKEKSSYVQKTAEETAAELEVLHLQSKQKKAKCTQKDIDNIDAIIALIKAGAQCHFCEGFGHQTFSCPNFLNLKKFVNETAMHLKPAYHYRLSTIFIGFKTEQASSVLSQADSNSKRDEDGGGMID